MELWVELVVGEIKGVKAVFRGFRFGYTPGVPSAEWLVPGIKKAPSLGEGLSAND